jgi:hypothetical protein
MDTLQPVPVVPSTDVADEGEEHAGADSDPALHYTVTVGCTSQAVRAFTYNRATLRLTIVYASKAVYRYEGVPPSIVEDLLHVLLTGQSVGRFVNRRIRSVFPYTRVL